MATIYFVGTYRPIKCGIADYTSFITRESPDGEWGVLSFDPDKYDTSLSSNTIIESDRVWYGLPNPRDISAAYIYQGLKEIGNKNKNAIVWFQHETAIWDNAENFAATLKNLNLPKAVTFHTLHFQSDETPSGLRRYQYRLLGDVLPHVEAITVFSQGVFNTVINAFPQYSHKVFLIKHGIHSFPEISRLSHLEAREKLNDFLLYESDLDNDTKEKIHRQRALIDKDAVIIAQTGFLCPLKQSESLFYVRDRLQDLLPHKRIIAIRIGSPRDAAQKNYAAILRHSQGTDDRFLLETMLPSDILPLAQRAFDFNFYWPSECTQSGILAHALGAGAIVAGRDIEGVGETLRESGQLVDTNLERLTAKIMNLITIPDLAQMVEENALQYAAIYSWKYQTREHYRLAEKLISPLLLPEARFPCHTTNLTSNSFSDIIAKELEIHPGNPFSSCDTEELPIAGTG